MLLLLDYKMEGSWQRGRAGLKTYQIGEYLPKNMIQMVTLKALNSELISSIYKVRKSLT